MRATYITGGVYFVSRDINSNFKCFNCIHTLGQVHLFVVKYIIIIIIIIYLFSYHYNIADEI